MKNKAISRRDLFGLLLQKAATPENTLSIYSIDDILSVRFAWRPHTKWAENNRVLSVSGEDDSLLFSEQLTDLQLYVSRHLDGTKTVSELCDDAGLSFTMTQSAIHEQVLQYICLALKYKLIETKK
ncbi:MAG: hypothetical protein KKD44_12960 [Proteobacteria bacterium]|nr:hypothetical protein [Pseudomonadota bacterium]